MSSDTTSDTTFDTTSDARRDRRMQHVTTTGSALAVALLPLVVGVLLARTVGADPMTPVNALIAGGGQRARLSRAQLRTCGGQALRTAGAGVWSVRAARPRRPGGQPAVGGLRAIRNA